MKYFRFDLVRWIYVTTMAAAFVTGCAITTPQREIPSTISPLPAEFPESYYRQAEAMGKTVMRISPDQSLLSIEVRRAGTLARLGHDHVVASHDISGYVAPDEGRADLILPLAKLTVDETNLRAEAGFNTQPTPEAIDGTRNNMLTKVLEADRFPFILIHAI
ncbi:MAG: YceI family protein, partial [Burkholderiaceae bacterium]